jgi:hypothetical protein
VSSSVILPLAPAVCAHRRYDLRSCEAVATGIELMRRRRCRWQQASLSWWVALVFLIATTVPHFGTLWHTHAGGRYTHTHARLSETAGTHSHTHDDEPRLTAFGHAHHGEPGSHHHAHAGTTAHAPQHATPHHAATTPALAAATDADLHWHFFEESLPVGFLVLLVWLFGLGMVRLLIYQPLSQPTRYRRAFFSRAPPAA